MIAIVIYVCVYQRGREEKRREEEEDIWPLLMPPPQLIIKIFFNLNKRKN